MARNNGESGTTEACGALLSATFVPVLCDAVKQQMNTKMDLKYGMFLDIETKAKLIG